MQTDGKFDVCQTSVLTAQYFVGDILLFLMLYNFG